MTGQAKRIASSFNDQQIMYVNRLAEMQGVKPTTYVTNLVVDDIKRAITDGRLPINLPSLERRHIIMAKFVRYLFLMNFEADNANNSGEENTDLLITEADFLSHDELTYVASVIDIEPDIFKKTFFQEN